jgi:hypothetical protein
MNPHPSSDIKIKTSNVKFEGTTKDLLLVSVEKKGRFRE